VAIVASVAVWLVVVSLTLFRPGGVVSAPSRALAGLVDCWFDLLMMAPPGPPEPRLLVGVHALVWIAAYTTAELVARTRTVLPAVLPGFVVLSSGLGFGAGGSSRTVALTAVSLVAAIMLVLVRHSGGGNVLRTVLFGVPWVAGIAGLAVLAVPAVLVGSHRQPFDPRHVVHPPGLAQTAVSPLDRVSAWLGEPDVSLFTVAAARPQNWRIAVLDVFDGRTWRTDGRFLATDYRVPLIEDGPQRELLRQVVTVDSLAGPWLPAASAPVEIAGVSALADPRTGVLMSRSEFHAGVRYQVTSQVRTLTAEHLRHVVAAPAEGSQLDLPAGLPDAVMQAADTATAGAGTAFEQAHRLETYLRTLGTNDPSSPPGHSYGHLGHFLTVSHRGTSEQFATAFAVMARSLGLPCRVVVGFRQGEQVSAQMWRVRGGDALVWPEVAFDKLGWVPFYPTPSATAPGRDGVLAEGQSSQRVELDRSLAAPEPAATTPNITRAASRAPAKITRKPAWWLAAAGLAVASAGYVVAVVLVPAIRTYRRRRLHDPAARVAAAWHDTVIALGWVGLNNVAALTTGEVATIAAQRLGPAAPADLGPLAALADEAAFSGQPLARASGSVAWRHRDRLSTLVSRRVGRLGALRRRLSPRALRS
jgi:transglutaminase-like putative cysteine protease